MILTLIVFSYFYYNFYCNINCNVESHRNKNATSVLKFHVINLLLLFILYEGMMIN
jgi:hypothetical protein